MCRRLLALALTLLPAATARADFLPPSAIPWSYTVVPAVPAVPAANNPAAGIRFSSVDWTNNIGPTVVVLTQLQPFSTARAGAPDTLGDGAPYALAVTLADGPSGDTGTLVFTGTLRGTLADGTSTIANQFDEPTSQPLQLGDSYYVVTLGPYEPPGVTAATDPGAILARVAIGPVLDVLQAPEPSSLLLGCLGLPLLAILRPGRTSGHSPT
jgi:hypothetical protein